MHHGLHILKEKNITATLHIEKIILLEDTFHRIQL